MATRITVISNGTQRITKRNSIKMLPYKVVILFSMCMIQANMVGLRSVLFKIQRKLPKKREDYYKSSMTYMKGALKSSCI